MYKHAKVLENLIDICYVRLEHNTHYVINSKQFTQFTQ